MIIANWISLCLIMIGAGNWLTIGIFNFNFVNWICFGNTIIERIIYSLVGIASIYIGVVLAMNRGTLPLQVHEEKKDIL